jgi:uncharacterized membrane protein
MSAKRPAKNAEPPERFMTPFTARLIGLSGTTLVAVCVALFSPSWMTGWTRAVAAYDAAAIVYLIAIWTLAMHSDPRKTQRRAQLQDPGHNLTLGIVLFSAAAGLLSAIEILGIGSHAPKVEEQHFAYAIALVGVAAGWLLIHSMFALRYAHMFYYDGDQDAEADRGLTFPGTENPSDQDFAYFSFVIGMTFQVSDVQVTDPGVRRTVLAHGVLSFAYNTVILAFGINVLAGLIKH